jgi:glycosyltransferase involved in cell wall biosynthesis
VLIPARNAAPWIGQTLASVAAQTWPAIEVIVAESDSTDATREVVRRHLSKAVHLLPPVAGATAAANRNRALRAAQGEFLQFLDADDLIGPDKVKLQVGRILDRPDDVASGEWARFLERPEEARFVAEPVWCDLAAREWLIRAWTGGQPMMQPGIFLVPRSVVDRAGTWHEALTLIDDFEYMTRIMLAAREVRFAAGARLYYRSGNPHSLASRRTPDAWQSAWQSLDLGTRALMASADSAQARAACADLFQQLAFEACLEHEDVARRAQQRAEALGGSRVRMSGGLLFRLLRDVAGWKAAKRVKRACYRLGYDRFARMKESGWPKAGCV